MRNSGQEQSSTTTCRFVVIGGGIAGSTCAIELKRLRPSSEVTLVCPTPVVKAVRGVQHLTPCIGVVDVEERSADDFAMSHQNISLLRDSVTRVDKAQGHVLLASGNTVAFTRCCVATGATPILTAIHPRVIGIRDMESVETLSERLMNAKKVLIIGNGGIALELVHALTSVKACQVVWAVRDDYVGNTFFDATASEFLLPTLSRLTETSTTPPTTPTATQAPAARRASAGVSQEGREPSSTRAPPSAHADPIQCAGAGSADNTDARIGFAENCPPDPSMKRKQGGGGEAGVKDSPLISGGGLGPDWVDALKVKGLPVRTDRQKDRGQDEDQPDRRKPCLDIQFLCELESIIGEQDRKDPSGESWPVWARLTNGAVVGCDFVVSATGVAPNTDVLGPEYERGEDGGLVVDDMMRVSHIKSTAPPGETNQGGDTHVLKAKTSEHTIFAAGDCCCLDWPKRESSHWFQMRLWSQARSMGLYTAKCMADCVDELGSVGAFDLFVHATEFFGHKVALLGNFNGQGLGPLVQDFVSRRLAVNGGASIRQQVRSECTQDESSDRCRAEGGPADVLQAEGTMGVGRGSSEIMDGTAVLVRMTPGVEYIKVVLENGKVMGAMLIGDTGLEETFENLILNGTDVTSFGSELLSVDVDIEDFFD